MPAVRVLDTHAGRSPTPPPRTRRRTALRCLLSVAVLLAAVPRSLAQLSEEEAQSLDNIVDQMTIQELLGQTLIVGYHAQVNRNLVRESNDGLEALIKAYKVGGVILRRQNIPSAEDERQQHQAVWNVTDSLQEATFNSQYENRKVPLMIAIDQEGGGRMQIKDGITRTPDPMYIGATRSPDYALIAGRIIGSELNLLGVNTVLAPVADINNNDTRDVVGKRSFGAHKDLVAPLAVCFMQGLRKSGVLSIAKHYPGHGDAEQDPHFEISKVGYETTAQLRDWDLYPFRQLIDFGVNGLMTAHLIVRPLDNKPVTISAKAIADLREGDPRFNGIVMSDDIANMMGILDYIDPPGDLSGDALNEHTNQQRFEVMRRALEAGTDMVMLASIDGRDNVHKPERTVTADEFKAIYDQLIDHFSSEEGRDILRRAARRVLREKAQLVPPGEFQDRNAWQSSLDEKAFKQLRSEHTRQAKEITREAVIQITNRGKFVNDLHESTLFEIGEDPSTWQGPLSQGRLLRTVDDRLLIVSPVFKDDVLTRYIKEHPDLWFPTSNIDTELLIYGWKETDPDDPDLLPGAAKHWNLTGVKRYYRTTYSGETVFLDDNIREKVDELVEKAQAASAVIFGLVTEAHIKILEGFLDRVDDRDVIVLLQKEPYFLPADIYEKQNVSVLFTPSLPDEELAVDALFGRVMPKPIRNLPFNIPNKVNVARGSVHLETETECQLKKYEDYRVGAWGAFNDAKKLVNDNKKGEAIDVLKEGLRLARQAIKFAGTPEEEDGGRAAFEKIDETLLELSPD